MIEDLIIRFKQDPEFERWLFEIKQARPLVPTFNYKNSNVEDWKYLSAKREGFDLALHYLRVNLEELT
jgi:hypothetical protein